MRLNLKAFSFCFCTERIRLIRLIWGWKRRNTDRHGTSAAAILHAWSWKTIPCCSGFFFLQMIKYSYQQTVADVDGMAGMNPLNHHLYSFCYFHTLSSALSHQHQLASIEYPQNRTECCVLLIVLIIIIIFIIINSNVHSFRSPITQFIWLSKQQNRAEQNSHHHL